MANEKYDLTCASPLFFSRKFQHSPNGCTITGYKDCGMLRSLECSRSQKLFHIPHLDASNPEGEEQNKDLVYIYLEMIWAHMISLKQSLWENLRSISKHEYPLYNRRKNAAESLAPACLAQITRQAIVVRQPNEDEAGTAIMLPTT